ncbi:MAG TPA: HIT family protein [Candidatus Limnocylindria bacterium]|nr:HIT family protein [Candidatus Limnocylindria bacterium]
MKACAFCAIARGEEAGHVVLETDGVVAFLDRAPLVPGHTLVVTREHHATFDDVPLELLAPLLAAAQRLSVAMRRGLGADGSFTAINTRVSQSVAHVHLHVVPRREGDGLFRAGMVWIRKRYPAGEAERIAARLREALDEA